MRKIVCSILLSCFFITTNAQLILPEFRPAEKQEAFSSDNEENVPLLFNNGTEIYYNMTYVEGFEHKTRVVGQDIWHAKKEGDDWGKPYRLFREEDVEGENLIVGTTPDGKRVYLFNTLVFKDSISRRLIYLDNKKKDKWHDPVEVIIPGLEFGENYLNFYVNPEETVILISKPPKQSANDEDIFVSLKNEDGSWGELINVGKKINTKRFELASYISDDLKALYFSSEGHGGYGSSDIFVSYRLDDTWQNWTNPLNLGGTINSADYEAFFVMGTPTEVYFTSNRNSNHSSIYKSEATGGIVLANEDSIYGQFVFKSLQAEEINIRIENKDGELIDKVLVDDQGRFKFAKLEGDELYILTIDNEDSEFYEGSKIYFIDANEVKTRRFVFNKEGVFQDSRTIEAKTEVTGIFKYDGIPLMKSGLEVYDENGFLLDTVYTDETGKFSYSLLKYDDGFSLIPMNMTEDDLINSEAVLINKEGEVIEKLKSGEYNVLESIKLNKEASTSQEVGSSDNDNKSKKGKVFQAEAWNGMSLSNRSIYFDFNQAKMPLQERNKLSLLISILKVGPEMKANLIGHTDNKGSESFNQMFGLKRAKEVKRYLVNHGVTPSQVMVSSKGFSEPVEDNSTEEGQAKNRRVEVMIE